MREEIKRPVDKLIENINFKLRFLSSELTDIQKKTIHQVIAETLVHVRGVQVSCDKEHSDHESKNQFNGAARAACVNQVMRSEDVKLFKVSEYESKSYGEGFTDHKAEMLVMRWL